ncbi:hypothetical protein DSCA_42550 [Desulfosarcina alkanivorans]|uniref:Thioesterase domain-containing protein n=1 Tax=Desulfosarcina alkanivorans TaxID=571177 RepID=A0A5K7YPQ4_9BACT|nr:PaaI family thioesterase [Desulfosarcina alkanivorans]BBO70325.1 hypothetical protein DSCA_42550 [Desulfosarcina alkanivorans]
MPSPNPAYIDALIRVINASPFPSHMSMRLESIAFDQAMVSLETGPCHLQAYGIAHGGVLATLIDTATFWAVFLRLPQGDGLVNVDLKLNYLKPVTEGVLTAAGRCIRAGRSLSYAEAGVTDADGTLVAHGTSTLMTLPGKGLSLNEPKFLTAG